MLDLNAGEATISSLIAEDKIRVEATAPDLVSSALTSASEDLEAARLLHSGELHSLAFNHAYDGVRKALDAFLSAQGLRVTGARGHHPTLLDAALAQLQRIITTEVANAIHDMRAGRNDSQYGYTAPDKTSDQAEQAIDIASKVHQLVSRTTQAGVVPQWDAHDR